MLCRIAKIPTAYRNIHILATRSSMFFTALWELSKRANLSIQNTAFAIAGMENGMERVDLFWIIDNWNINLCVVCKFYTNVSREVVHLKAILSFKTRFYLLGTQNRVCLVGRDTDRHHPSSEMKWAFVRWMPHHGAINHEIHCWRVQATLMQGCHTSYMLW